MADATALGAVVRKDVWVQVPPSAQQKMPASAGDFRCISEMDLNRRTEVPIPIETREAVPRPSTSDGEWKSRGQVPPSAQQSLGSRLQTWLGEAPPRHVSLYLPSAVARSIMVDIITHYERTQ